MCNRLKNTTIKKPTRVEMAHKDLRQRGNIRNYNRQMKYRPLGFKGPIVSILGFGCARLINPDESKKAIIEAISQGINLFETGPGYGDSELIIGEAIKGYRDKAHISTKYSLVDEHGVPISQDDLFHNVEISLKRLKVDKIDIFNAWNIFNPEHFEAARKKLGFIDGVRKLMDEGIIDHFGFSSHDSPENIKKYIDSDEFELAILPYSIVNITYENTINYAYRKGLGVIAMKPLHGGVVTLLSDVFPDQNSDDLAIKGLQFVSSLQSISSAIAGMTKTSEVENNIKLVRGIERLGYTFRNNISERYKSFYCSQTKLCSACRYCDSCPVNIPIPKLMKLYNVTRIFGNKKRELQQFLKAETIQRDDIKKCLECKQCEKKCPENLNIIERLKELYKMLSD